ncbi:MAG: phasin family protein [Candidatus Wallbacteria bacterium]|nr:phasin family protein [Candidatus Wallbacteria bacterium]
MATQTKDTARGEGNPWVNQIRNVLLAGVGAVVLAQEELEDFVGKLVKKGEMAEKDGKKLLGDILARRKRQAKRDIGSIESTLACRIENALHRVRLVSKKDVDQLSNQIDALAAEVDRLARDHRAH